MKFYLVFAIIFLFIETAQANPNTNYYFQGSAFLVRASNPDQREWNCSMSYTISYDDYGTPRSQNFNQNFVVPINYNGIVVNHQTAWPASSLSVSNVNGPNCS